jgi:hypothetical protein
MVTGGRCPVTGGLVIPSVARDLHLLVMKEEVTA